MYRYVCVYMYIYIYVCVYIYIHMYQVVVPTGSLGVLAGMQDALNPRP